MQSLDYIQKDTSADPEYAIIWLHGLGADGNDFLPIVDALEWPKNLGIKFIFPHAPLKKVTINMGMEMRAWYDITDMSFTRKIDVKDYLNSTKEVQKLIKLCEKQGINANKIIIAGFSQGAALALNVALSYDKKLAGALLLSGYLVDESLIINQKKPQNDFLDFFVGHGVLDPVVPYKLGQNLSEFLTKQGYKVTFKNYQQPHNVSSLEFDDILKWTLAKLSRA